MSAYNRNKATGIRDYAIARCFIDLGLRCIEVTGLSLDDFDWNNGTITIHDSKTHSMRTLPLPKQTGNAIVCYLQTARPKVIDRYLFLRLRDHCGLPMTDSQVRRTISAAAVNAGLKCFTGPHMLRHSTAKSLIDNGVSIKEIADILGHKSIQTTMIYIRIQYDELREVAAPWPEVSP